MGNLIPVQVLEASFISPTPTGPNSTLLTPISTQITALAALPSVGLVPVEISTIHTAQRVPTQSEPVQAQFLTPIKVLIEVNKFTP